MSLMRFMFSMNDTFLPDAFFSHFFFLHFFSYNIINLHNLRTSLVLNVEKMFLFCWFISSIHPFCFPLFYFVLNSDIFTNLLDTNTNKQTNVTDGPAMINVNLLIRSISRIDDVVMVSLLLSLLVVIRRKHSQN